MRPRYGYTKLPLPYGAGPSEILIDKRHDPKLDVATRPTGIRASVIGWRRPATTSERGGGE